MWGDPPFTRGSRGEGQAGLLASLAASLLESPRGLNSAPAPWREMRPVHLAGGRQARGARDSLGPEDPFEGGKKTEEIAFG